MKHLSLAHRLPQALTSRLFGDRREFGLTVKPEDACWQEWLQTRMEFYGSQTRGVGRIVNDAGYEVMRYVDIEGQRVLEIGPGDLRHARCWNGRPASYVIADVSPEMLELAGKRLEEHGTPYDTLLLPRSDHVTLPFAEGEFDLVVSFYCLEHLYPLAPFLSEIVRVLKRGGRLVGGIPTEGGLAWGVGRFLTTRRWLKRNTSINPDKIVCWVHPNFAEHIIRELDGHLGRKKLNFWPLRIPLLDVNLVVKFVYEKN